MANEITEVTRRNIIDYLTASGTSWAGWLPEDEFLARLYEVTRIYFRPRSGTSLFDPILLPMPGLSL